MKLQLVGVGCAGCLPPFKEALATLSEQAVLDFDNSNKTAVVTLPATISDDQVMAAFAALPEGKSATIVATPDAI